MCWRVERHLDCDPATPAQARRFAVRELSKVAPTTAPVPAEWRSLTEDAELVVSELATNSMRAKCEALDVILELHHTELVVRVRDDAPGVPVRRAPPATDTSGRGLQLVAAVSTAWGTEFIPNEGKQVWARLAVPATCKGWVDCFL